MILNTLGNKNPMLGALKSRALEEKIKINIQFYPMLMMSTGANGNFFFLKQWIC
jgi:hypothetical protein